MFVDCDETGADFDYDDLGAKLTARTRAIMPVYMWGRAADPGRFLGFASSHGLHVIEDACQAHGMSVGGKALGTFGDAGCFSLKDGKILWSGEGGFILTSSEELADRCRAFRTHWQAAPAGSAPMSELGHNYRMTEIQAMLARWNLARFDDLLNLRRAQTAALKSALSSISELQWRPPRDRAGSPRLACRTASGRSRSWQTIKGACSPSCRPPVPIRATFRRHHAGGRRQRAR